MRLTSKAGRLNIASACLLPVLAFLACPAAADSTSVGVSLTTDRDAHDLSDPSDTKVEISAAHNFDSGVILGASTESSNTAFSDKAKVNLEGTIGYRAQLGDLFSVTGSAGLGERIHTSGSGDNFPYYVFPYYVFRIGTDVKVDDDVTWNVLSFRYRNAFDPDDDFLTPRWQPGFHTISTSTDRSRERSNIIGRIGSLIPSDWTSASNTGSDIFQSSGHSRDSDHSLDGKLLVF